MKRLFSLLIVLLPLCLIGGVVVNNPPQGGTSFPSNTTINVTVTNEVSVTLTNTGDEAGILNGSGTAYGIGTQQTGVGTCPNCVTNVSGEGNIGIKTQDNVLVVFTQNATNGYKARDAITGSNVVITVENGTLVLHITAP